MLHRELSIATTRLVSTPSFSFCTLSCTKESSKPNLHFSESGTSFTCSSDFMESLSAMEQSTPVNSVNILVFDAVMVRASHKAISAMIATSLDGLEESRWRNPG